MPVDENGRALVLTFGTNQFGANGWDVKQWVYVYAVDDPRSEGDVVTVVQHSTISADPNFDAVAVRNVEVSLRDNDTPGVYVTEVAPGSCAVKCDEDKRTLVIEGIQFGADFTGRLDDLAVQLQMDPGAATIRVKIVLDAATQRQVELTSTDPRFKTWVHNDANPLLRFTYYTIDFDTTNWDAPVIVVVKARPDADPEDPFTAVIRFGRDDKASFTDLSCLPGAPDSLDDVEDVDYAGCDIDGVASVDAGQTYVFPNIRSGRGIVAATVIDDETADVIAIESGVDTVVQQCGNAACTIPGLTDDYTIRLTKRPEVLNDDVHTITPVDVDVAILVDGLTDVFSIGGVAITPAGYDRVGGDIASQRFNGNLTITGGTTITRANGSELGSFVEEGFIAGQRIRTSFTGLTVFTVLTVSDDVLTVAGGLPNGPQTGATISTLTRSGIWNGSAIVELPEQDAFGTWEGWTLVRSTGGWLADGFLEGQWVEICDQNALCGRFKIQVIRGTNPTFDNKLELRYVDGLLRRQPGGLRERPVHGHPDRRRRPLRRHQLVPRAAGRAAGRRVVQGPDCP